MANKANFEYDIRKIVARWTDINKTISMGKLRYFDSVVSGRLRNNLTAKHWEEAGKIVSELEFYLYGKFLDAGIYGRVRWHQVPLAKRKRKGLGMNAYRKAWYQKVLYPRIGFLRNVTELNMQETIISKIKNVLSYESK